MSWRKIVAVVLLILIALPITFVFASDRIRSVTPPWLVKKLAGVFIMPDKLKRLIPPTLPENRPIEEAYWLEQGWDRKRRFWFHHASQGTSTLPIPYEWFVALEQPGLGFIGESTLLKDPDYLRQFGFIPSPRTLNTSPETLKRFGYRDEPAVDDAERRGRSDEFPEGLRKRLPENVDGLPVGFSRTPGYRDPITGEPLPDQIGFTCAGCHTGQLEYEGVSLRYDGGPALINLPEFQQALGLAIWYTSNIPGRFRRFADRVLGLKHTRGEFLDLKKRFDKLVETGTAQREREHDILYERGLELGKKLTHVEEGFGRLDALNRIGNHVFYKDFLYAGGADLNAGQASRVLKFNVEDNFARLVAPVSFPPLWDTPWFLWAQYDASILQPMIRNAGEALGVGARVNLVNPANGGKGLFSSSLDAEDLHNIEQLLAGKEHPLSSGKPGFKGLTSPRWPGKLFMEDGAIKDLLSPEDREKWKIRPEKLAAGRRLYAELCVECHLEPVNDPDFKRESGHDKDFWSSDAWKPFARGSTPYLHVVQKPTADMATDGELAKVLAERTVKLPEFLRIDPAKDLERWGCAGLPGEAEDTLFALALMVVVDKSVGHWLSKNNISEERRREWLGDRPNCPNSKMRHYRARPLDGIWATAPYLHNGSVPNLWALLSPKPKEDRPQTFCTSSREFDPVRVGYQTKCESDRFQRDTSVEGNYNGGHEFTAPKDMKMSDYPRGVIGRALTDAERENLIEYLKTL